MEKRPFLLISLVFLSGIMLASFLKKAAINTIIITAIISIIFFIVYFRNRVVSHIFLYLLISLAGFMRFREFNELPKNHIAFIVSKEPKSVALKGKIINNPVFTRRFDYYPELTFVLDLNAVKCYDKWADIKGLVLIKMYFYGDKTFKYKDNLMLEGEISKPKSEKGAKFNYEMYLAGKRIYAVSRVRNSDYIEKIENGSSVFDRIMESIYSIKNKLTSAILINLPPPHSGVLAAMLFGERQFLSSQIKDVFIKTGTLHILAISGLHITMLIFIILGLFKLIRLPQKVSYFFTIFILIIYALMVGPMASVWRAVVMAVFFLFGYILDKRIDIENIYGLTLFALLAKEPNYIYDAGFILSFVCIAAMIWVYPILKKLFIAGDGNIILSFLSDYILMSLSVWVSILPIVAYYFKMVTPVILIANIIAIPSCFILVSLGIASVFIYILLPNFGIIFFESVYFVDTILLYSLKLLSNMPLAFFRLRSFTMGFVFFYYAVLFLVLIGVRKKIVTFP